MAISALDESAQTCVLGYALHRTPTPDTSRHFKQYAIRSRTPSYNNPGPAQAFQGNSVLICILPHAAVDDSVRVSRGGDFYSDSTHSGSVDPPPR